MTKIVRVGVTFPPELLKDLDEIIDDIGYESRSKAIQDAVTSFVTEQKLLKKQKGKKGRRSRNGLRSRRQRLRR